MKTSFAAHQKHLDEEAEIEQAIEQTEDEMRYELLADNHYELWEKKPGSRFFSKIVYDRDNVVGEMGLLDGDGFNQAVMMMPTNPTEAARIIKDLIPRAVEQIIGEAKIREHVEFEREQDKREVAA